MNQPCHEFPAARRTGFRLKINVRLSFTVFFSVLATAALGRGAAVIGDGVL